MFPRRVAGARTLFLCYDGIVLGLRMRGTLFGRSIDDG